VRDAAAATGFTGSITALIAAAAKNTAKAYAAVPGISPATTAATQAAVKDTHVKAYSLIYLIAIAFGCIAIIAATTIKGVSADQRTVEVSARLEDDKDVHPKMEGKVVN
jgi:hypothetical protein